MLLNKMDFLESFDVIHREVDTGFHIETFYKTINNLSESDFLILDIYTCNDGKDILIDGIKDLKELIGMETIIFIPNADQSKNDIGGVIRALRINNILTLFEENYKEKLIQKFNDFYKPVIKIKNDVTLSNNEEKNRNAQLRQTSKVCLTQNDLKLLDEIMMLLGVDDG